MKINKKECIRCLFNDTAPSLKLDKNNICQFCKMHDEMENDYPLNEFSEINLQKIADNIRLKGRNKKYDCVVGVSGGRDSSYLLYIVKNKMNLRPLAVHYDNGFNSEVSVSNILKLCEKLNVDLETKVADWDTIKDITKSFFKAAVSDPDTPTDVGIFKTIYEIAYREKIKYVFHGHSFRTEGIEPLEWTYMDGLYVKSIHKKYGNSNLSKFDNFSLIDLIKYKFFANIKTILPLNYINYNSNDVKKVLKENFETHFYGGHHHESVLTKFIVAYYLPKKFNIDRRITQYSALVRSNQISKSDAKEVLNKPVDGQYDENLKKYIIDKLSISENEFEIIMNKENKNFKDFITYYNFFSNFGFFAKILCKLNLIPKLLYLRYFGHKY